MAYGTEARSPKTAYRMVLQHDATTITANVTVIFNDPPASTEAQRDSIFQSFLTRVSGITGATVLSAEKMGGYSTPVTP
ncbi:MAG TPA: hypothetical protein VIY48_11850 [Candidatus Paceibacterota bacterium]